MEYISATDTAKLVRQAIKRTTDVKASVRTDKYAGGASIRVTLPKDTDTETIELVRKAVAPYEGRGFEGSIDLAYSIGAVLLEDGTVLGTESAGTAGSAGSVPRWDHTATVPPGARQVRFMANYVFVSCDWR